MPQIKRMNQEVTNWFKLEAETTKQGDETTTGTTEDATTTSGHAVSILSNMLNASAKRRAQPTTTSEAETSSPTKRCKL